jgi:hypothetical protein
MPHLRFAPAVISLALALAVGVANAPAHAQQTDTSIGIDADTSGNTDTALGAIDDCVVISEGESHEVDIFIRDVTDLLAWEAVLTFEPAVLVVVAGDVQLFMAANEGSDVQDVSGELPDRDGRFLVQVFDAADPLAPDSGSGVLARVTVKGIGPGVSELRLPLSDLDDDGNPDEGPLLRDIDVNSIGDVNGDTLFDGPITEARIAVDASCTDEPGPAVLTAGEGAGEGGNAGNGIDALTIVIVVVGVIASVAVGGGAAAWAIRRRLSHSGGQRV